MYSNWPADAGFFFVILRDAGDICVWLSSFSTSGIRYKSIYSPLFLLKIVNCPMNHWTIKIYYIGVFNLTVVRMQMHFHAGSAKDCALLALPVCTDLIFDSGLCWNMG